MKAIAEIKSETEQKDEIGVAVQTWLSASWTDGLIAQSVRASEWNSVVMGFKFHPGQLSIATSKNPSVVNTICIRSFHYSHVITSAKFQLK